MRKPERGMFARSLAGHDKGKLYVIMDVGADRVELSDGVHHTAEHPKVKKLMHVQIDYGTDGICSELFQEEELSVDQKVQKALKAKENRSCQKQMS